MGVWTFLLTLVGIFIALGGLLTWRAAAGDVLAGTIAGSLATLIILIIGYGLREMSQFNFNRQKMEENKQNIEENADLMQQQLRTSLLLAKTMNEQNKGLIGENKTLRNDPRLLNVPGDSNEEKFVIDFESFENYEE